MRRRLAALAAALTSLAAAPAAHATFFPAEVIDGPSTDIRTAGDVDVARDGNGLVAYVRRDGGIDHIFVSRLVGGAWQAPERVDGGLDAASSQPAAAASDGGRLVVVFISGGQAFSVVRPAGAGAWTAPQLLASGASRPAVDMSINGVAYATFSTGGDLLAARLDRNADQFALLPAPLDVDQPAIAGEGAGRSRVAVSADGTGLAVWGEAGHVYARRLFGLNVSAAPQQVDVDSFDGHDFRGADLPDVDIEDDSSFAWVGFREVFADGAGTTTRALARHLRGSRFEDPVAVDGLGWGGESAANVDVDLNGRGDGLAGVGTTVSGTAMAAMLKDNVFNAGLPMGGIAGTVPAPVGAISETYARVLAWAQGTPSEVHARYFDDKVSVRTPPAPGPETVLSDPAAGPVDPAAGLDAASDRGGDVAMTFVQETGDGRRLMGASYDRPPGALTGSTSSKWRSLSRTALSWSSGFELWGPLTYTVLIDGKPAATTQDTKASVAPGSVPDGIHQWRVVATDRRGQTSTSPLRVLRTDGVPPEVGFSVRRKRRVATVTANAADVIPPSGRAAGVAYVRIDFGDGSGFVLARKARHAYAHKGAYTVRVSATDRAGNAVAVTRRIHIGK